MRQHERTWKTSCEVNKPVTKGQALHDPTYSRNLEESNPKVLRRKWRWLAAGVKGNGELLFNKCTCSVWEDKF